MARLVGIHFKYNWTRCDNTPHTALALDRDVQEEKTELQKKKNT